MNTPAYEQPDPLPSSSSTIESRPPLEFDCLPSHLAGVWCYVFTRIHEHRMKTSGRLLTDEQEFDEKFKLSIETQRKANWPKLQQLFDLYNAEGGKAIARIPPEDLLK